MSLHRFFGIALQCALLATYVAGGGNVCDLTSGGATHMTMSEMPMSDVSMPDMPALPAQAPSSADGSSDTSSHHHQDCSLPWSSADCGAMTSCAANALTADEATLVALMPLAHQNHAWRADPWASVARSPDPPPPKA